MGIWGVHKGSSICGANLQMVRIDSYEKRATLVVTPYVSHFRSTTIIPAPSESRYSVPRRPGGLFDFSVVGVPIPASKQEGADLWCPG